MKKLFSLFLLILLPFIANADVVEVDGIYYNLLPKGNAAEVSSNPNGYKGDIIVPANIIYNDEVYNVTSVANAAFSGAMVSSINLPNTITYIGEGAFSGCSLTSFTMPNSVTSTGIYAFQGCSKLKTITLSNQLSSISGYIFWGCSSLLSIEIPESVTSIGYHSFASCSSLEFLEIPNSVNDISATAFWGCSKLTTIILPEHLTTINGYSFRDCTCLTSVSIPDNVSSIGGNAFHGCSNLESIVLGSNMSYLDDNSFSSCTKLKDVYCYASTPPSVMEKAFEGSYIEYVVLHVPKAYIEVYKATKPWSNFKAIVDISETPHTLKYVVDNNEYKSFQLYEGEVIIPLLEPSKEGYTFSGWNNLPSVMPGQDVIVTGSFAINKYKLTYMLDSEDYKTYEVEYGSTITPELAPTKEGYTFSGWSEIPTTMPAKDVTITGSFAINKYKLIYMIDGEEYKTYEVEYGVTITPELAPTKEGYTFSGWSEIPTTMPAKDVTITGSFAINKYKLIYMVDGEEYKTYEVEYGATITPEPIPTKEGYDFSGWSTIPETMPADDVTIIGTFMLVTTDDEIIITSAGQTTWCSAYDLDFTDIEGLKAYMAEGYNRTTGTIWLMRVFEVPAGEGILLIGDAGDYTIPHKSTTTYYMNMLVGTVTAKTINETDGEYTNYYLSSGDYGVGFYKVNGSVDLKANRAYLPLLKSTVSGSRGFIGIDFDDGEDGTTGISEAQQRVGEQDVWYNLQGQRVDNPSKGLYIRNGKKVIVK